MKYTLRAAKYLISICVLSTIVITALHAFGLSAGTTDDLLFIMTQTPRGWVFIALVIGLSVFYATMGFMKVNVMADIDGNRTQIDQAILNDGFILVNETRDELTFRASSIVKRILLRFDDTLVIRRQGPGIEIEGARKVVAQIQYRIEINIRNQNE